MGQQLLLELLVNSRINAIDESTWESMQGIGSFAVTHDHWADINTSKSWVLPEIESFHCLELSNF